MLSTSKILQIRLNIVMKYWNKNDLLTSDDVKEMFQFYDFHLEVEEALEVAEYGDRLVADAP